MTGAATMPFAKLAVAVPIEFAANHFRNKSKN
jgi:hypothetical protein